MVMCFWNLILNFVCLSAVEFLVSIGKHGFSSFVAVIFVIELNHCLRNCSSKVLFGQNSEAPQTQH